MQVSCLSSRGRERAVNPISANAAGNVKVLPTGLTAVASFIQITNKIFYIVK